MLSASAAQGIDMQITIDYFKILPSDSDQPFEKQHHLRTGKILLLQPLLYPALKVTTLTIQTIMTCPSDTLSPSLVSW